MLWAAAICANARGPRGCVTSQSAFLVEAGTEAEAFGKAMRIAEGVYPSVGGFTDRGASVSVEVVDLDLPINPCVLSAALREAIGLPPDPSAPRD